MSGLTCRLSHHSMKLALLPFCFRWISCAVFAHALAGLSPAFCAAFDYQGKTLEEWARGEGVAGSGFQEAVEHWGVDAVPEWVKLLAPNRTTGEKTAALSAIASVLRDNGLQKHRAVAAETAVPALL